MKRSTICSILLVMLGWAGLQAGGFGKLPVSARAVSLGGSLAAIGGDPNVLFVNPAGIGSLSGLNLSTSYTKLFAGIQDDDLSYISGSFGLDLGLLGTVGGGITAFSSNAWNEQEIIASYAQTLFGLVSVGGSAKFLHWSTPPPSGRLAVPEDGMSAVAVSFDAGVQVLVEDVFPANDIRVGMAVLDITRPSIASNGADEGKLDRGYQLGASYVSRELEYLVTIGYGERGDDGRFTLGAEIVAARGTLAGTDASFVVRAGANRSAGDDRSGDLFGGFGLTAFSVTIDYAFGQPARLEGLAGTHHISLRTAF